jgi:hypothetical protein
MPGKGTLTDSTTDVLQNYYGLAVRENLDDVSTMAKSIKASLPCCVVWRETVLLCFIEACDTLFPTDARSTVTLWLRNFWETYFFKDSNPKLKSSVFGLTNEHAWLETFDEWKSRKARWKSCMKVLVRIKHAHINILWMRVIHSSPPLREAQLGYGWETYKSTRYTRLSTKDVFKKKTKLKCSVFALLTSMHDLKRLISEKVEKPGGKVAWKS